MPKEKQTLKQKAYNRFIERQAKDKIELQKRAARKAERRDVRAAARPQQKAAAQERRREVLSSFSGQAYLGAIGFSQRNTVQNRLRGHPGVTPTGRTQSTGQTRQTQGMFDISGSGLGLRRKRRRIRL